ncbi:MAG: hypothetical protein J0L75_08105 [Spirochaetes bacterium]|nr:hypothetical protein [Spirochaetota bacterium]
MTNFCRPWIVSALPWLVFGCGALPNPTGPDSVSTRELPSVIEKMERARPGVFPATQPAPDGALGRNRSDGRYSSVRWQLDLLSLAAGGVARNDAEPVEAGLRALEYGFRHQIGGGGFDFSPIPGISQVPTEADLASAAAFFLASAGASVFLLDRCPWVQTNIGLRSRISALDPGLAEALSYLKAREALLMEADAKAPNRLLFDAMGALALSRHLSNSEGIELARRFVEKALALQDPAGWFKEGSGYDSSYQAVGALNLFYTAMMWPEDRFQQDLFDAFYRGAAWECGRILPSGEVSTFGNSRVFPGGESFLGEGKTVAALSVAQCLYAAGGLFGDSTFSAWADRVVKYYFKR